MLVLAGCATRPDRTPGPPAFTPAASSYIDLEAGWRLRVVTPILKSGGYRLESTAQQLSGNTITAEVSADFLGYEVAYYAVRAHGRIELVSVEVTRDGKTVPQSQSAARLFQLPRGAWHVRLIYLLRASHQDHDMAVAAARDKDALEALTQRVLENPSVGCRSAGKAACSWIPPGIAVVAEVPNQVDGAEQWVPAR